jgi:hypothetical protein
VVQDGVHLRVRAVRGGRELRERLEDGLDAFVLVPVDPALHEDRHLDVVAVLFEQCLPPCRVGEGYFAHLLPGLEVPALLSGVQRVHRDEEQVAPERRLPDHLQRHAALAAGHDVLERALDRVVGDVREAADRLARLRAVRQAPSDVRDRVAAPRRRHVRCRSGGRQGQQEGEYDEQDRPRSTGHEAALSEAVHGPPRPD